MAVVSMAQSDPDPAYEPDAEVVDVRGPTEIIDDDVATGKRDPVAARERGVVRALLGPEIRRLRKRDRGRVGLHAAFVPEDCVLGDPVADLERRVAES